MSKSTTPIKDAQELNAENLQRLLKTISTSASMINIRTPRYDWPFFIPWRPCAKEADPKEFPFKSLGLISMMTYHWMTMIVYRIYKKKHLDLNNIYYLPYEERSHHNRLRLEDLWMEETKRKAENARLSSVLIKHSMKLFMIAFVINLLGGIVSLIFPTFLFRWLLEYAQGSHTDVAYGFFLVLLLFLAESCRCFLTNGSMFLSILCACRLKAGFMALMYKKIIHMRGLQTHSIGELINIFANDSQRLFDFCVHTPPFVIAPMIVVTALVYCSLYIGPWCLIGTLFLGLHFLYQHTIASANSYIRAKAIAATDLRIHQTSELITSIRTIKLNTWEKSFSDRIAKSREAEENCLKRAAYIQHASVAIIPLVTLMSLLTIFGGYIGTGNNLLPSQAFVIMSVYNLIRTTTSILPNIIRNWSDLSHGLKRAENLMKSEEVDFRSISPITKYPENAIEVEGATFGWMKAEHFEEYGHLNYFHFSLTDEISKKHSKSALGSMASRSSSPHLKSESYVPVLTDIHLTVGKGKIVAICGNIGSGKSSLLSALVGQMKLMKGRTAIQGNVGYVKQEAWIFHGTIRDNILFGSIYQEKWYRYAIEQCLLTVDFKTLPLGDETIIGESGVNLSDGQKQRVGLARVIYANTDVLLLDDPLSAVDSSVRQYLFINCLKKAAKRGKTVLFNTQNLEFLIKCDEVIFLKKGRIISMGSHVNLMETDEGYRNIFDKYISKMEMDGIRSISSIELLSSDQNQEVLKFKMSNAAFLEETRTPELSEESVSVEEYLPSKSVTWRTYRVYLKAVGGRTICISVILSFIMSSVFYFLGDLWLSNYLRSCDNDTSVYAASAANSDCERSSLSFFLVIYISIAGASVLMTGLRGFLFVKASMNGSNVIHKKILSKLIKTSMSYFDDIPPGKLLGTISSGIDGVDVRLPIQIEHLLINLSSVLICIISVTLTFPKFLGFVFLMGMVVYFLQRISRLVTRQLKIAESLTKGPVYGHVASTTRGLETIHAFRKMTDYTMKFQTLVDNHVSCLMMISSYTKWLGFRLEMLAIVFTSITAFLVVITKEQVEVSLAGLAIVYASQLNGLIRMTIRHIADTEARFTSVERMESFIKYTQEEGPMIVEENRPPAGWPFSGEIRFERFSLKYGAKYPVVLSDITCEIKSQEKIGIIGRTGSGKSSLSAALFRLVEHTEGTIIIDGINIAKIGLFDLRSRLSIVPQDPILFAGTLRYNLDPLGKFTDEEIWKALESCFMKKRVFRMNRKLDTVVVEAGSHFSTGERQLFCLARAFLKHSKIMVLDEVVASADSEIDQFIFNTIEESFADCTVLTIAHRISTLLRCNRIMVIEQGRIVEYDDPSILMENKNSRLTKMMI